MAAFIMQMVADLFIALAMDTKKIVCEIEITLFFDFIQDVSIAFFSK